MRMRFYVIENGVKLPKSKWLPAKMISLKLMSALALNMNEQYKEWGIEYEGHNGN